MDCFHGREIFHNRGQKSRAECNHFRGGRRGSSCMELVMRLPRGRRPRVISQPTARAATANDPPPMSHGIRLPVSGGGVLASAAALFEGVAEVAAGVTAGSSEVSGAEVFCGV